MPRITLERPGAPPVAYRFEGDAVTVGRAASNDLLLDDPLLSRRHLELIRDGDGRWRVRDLDSSNGTKLNGRAVRGSAPLADGDRIGLGGTTLVFSDAPAVARADAGGRDGGERETARLSGAVRIGPTGGGTVSCPRRGSASRRRPARCSTRSSASPPARRRC